jgi:Molybdenum cofactor biosynthesis enzyme
MCKGLDDSMVIEEIKLLEKSGGKSQWGKSLKGKRVLIKGEFRELIKEYVLKLEGDVVEDGNFDLLISTQRENMEEFSGLSAVINSHLFSVLPTELREGVRVGRRDGYTVVQLQPSEKLIRAFFEGFGSLLGNW